MYGLISGNTVSKHRLVLRGLVNTAAWVPTSAGRRDDAGYHAEVDVLILAAVSGGNEEKFCSCVLLFPGLLTRT